MTAGQGAGGMERLVFRDLTVKMRPAPNNLDAGSPFAVINQSEGSLKDVLFDRVRANAFNTSLIRGSALSPIEDVKFWGVEMTVEPRHDTASRPLFHLRHSRTPQFRFLYLTWPSNRSGWSGALQIEEVSGLKAPSEEIVETTLR